jgi:membrane protein YqaA with SNARE-associated domain
MEFLRALYDWTMGLMASPYAPWWLFAIAFAESSFFPIPPDILLIGMGIVLPRYSWMQFAYAAICTAGSAIGYYGGRPIAVRLFGEVRVAAAEKIYQKYDLWTVAVAGFTPIPYKVFTILTGVMRAGFWRFVWASAASRGARFFLVSGALFAMGPSVKGFLDRYFEWVTLGLAACVIGGFAALAWWSRKRAGGVTGSGQSGSNPSGTGSERHAL